MNFGVKIVAFYLGFVALIITLVVLSFKQDVDLVATDYYAQELKYQDRIDATNNANSLGTSIEHMVNAKGVTLKINPDILTSDFEGSVYFYRPSDSDKDLKLKLAFEEYEFIVPQSKLTKGHYKMQLHWKSGGKNYYKEEVININ
ncbi:MAG: FixH family protein [Bacteroidia bacterium]